MQPARQITATCSRAVRSLAIALALAAVSSALADDWPGWRGPDGTGVSREKDLPLSWSERVGVAWKVSPPGWGTSTPIVHGDAVFLTTQTDDSLLLLRLDKPTGKTVWSQTVG